MIASQEDTVRYSTSCSCIAHGTLTDQAAGFQYKE
jgi:hypothetical protein